MFPEGSGLLCCPGLPGGEAQVHAAPVDRLQQHIRGVLGSTTGEYLEWLREQNGKGGWVSWERGTGWEEPLKLCAQISSFLRHSTEHRLVMSPKCPWQGMFAVSALLEFCLCKQPEHKHNLLTFIFRLEDYPAFLFFLGIGGVYHPVSDAGLCSAPWPGQGGGQEAKTAPSVATSHLAAMPLLEI